MELLLAKECMELKLEELSGSCVGSVLSWIGRGG